MMNQRQHLVVTTALIVIVIWGFAVLELRAAETAGEVAIKPSDIVTNMPILAWPGGQR